MFFEIGIFHLLDELCTWVNIPKSGKKANFKVISLQVLKAGDARRINRNCSKKLGTFCKVMCGKIGGLKNIFWIINTNVCKLEVFYYICTKSKHLQL